jgi:hypothetical protein
MNLNNKKIRPCDLHLVSHETCICMYINAAANSVMLQLILWHDF